MTNPTPLDVPRLTIKFDVEEDGRHIAEVTDVPGAAMYGQTRFAAARAALTVAFKTLEWEENERRGEAAPKGRARPDQEDP